MTTWQKYGCFDEAFAHDFFLLILITLKQLRAKLRVNLQKFNRAAAKDYFSSQLVCGYLFQVVFYGAILRFLFIILTRLGY